MESLAISCNNLKINTNRTGLRREKQYSEYGCCNKRSLNSETFDPRPRHGKIYKSAVSVKLICKHQHLYSGFRPKENEFKPWPWFLKKTGKQHPIGSSLGLSERLSQIWRITADAPLTTQVYKSWDGWNGRRENTASPAGVSRRRRRVKRERARLKKVEAVWHTLLS